MGNKREEEMEKRILQGLEREISGVVEFNKAIGMIYRRYPNIPREKKEKLMRGFFEGLEKLDKMYCKKRKNSI